MINCGHGKGCCVDPSGVWDYKDMIGAKVVVKSMPVGNFFKMTSCSKTHTIKDIYFRVTLDGKTITLVELEGADLEGIYFNWKDLIIIDITEKNAKNTIKYPVVGDKHISCGTAIANKKEEGSSDEEN